MATPTEQDRERATALVVSCVKITTLKEADRRRVTMDGEKPWRIAQVAAEQIEPAIAQALADERERCATIADRYDDGHQPYRGLCLAIGQAIRAGIDGTKKEASDGPKES